jgi:transcriptional regulator with XRE-family HTH domain
VPAEFAGIAVTRLRPHCSVFAARYLAMESEELQRAVKERAAEMIAEEMNLREVRRLRKLTQARLSKKLKIGQEGVSRIEKRSDLYISTLRNYVEGVGGKPKLVVELPDRAPVILSELGEDQGEKRAKKITENRAKSRPKSRRVA